MKVRRNAAIYFAIQGTAVLAWWAMLYLYPTARQYFVLEVGSDTSLLAFWLADIVFIGVGSLAAGLLCYRGSEYRQIASWMVTGAISYASIYCLAFALMTDVGWLGVILMLPAMIWTGVFSVGMSFEKMMFRKAADSTTGWIMVKTFTQIIVVWSVILVIFPLLISVVEDKLGISRLSFLFQRPIAAILFVLISSMGLYSAYVMSRVGKGTPLPLDHAKNLVIAGPYSFVRNPMALSGIGQGLAVALFLGSPLVAIYALMGSLIWQLIFRPLEEQDLSARFGPEYDHYCNAVRCWIPAAKPYRKTILRTQDLIE